MNKITFAGYYTADFNGKFKTEIVDKLTDNKLWLNNTLPVFYDSNKMLIKYELIFQTLIDYYGDLVLLNTGLETSKRIRLFLRDILPVIYKNTRLAFDNAIVEKLSPNTKIGSKSTTSSKIDKNKDYSPTTDAVSNQSELDAGSVSVEQENNDFYSKMMMAAGALEIKKSLELIIFSEEIKELFTSAISAEKLSDVVDIDASVFTAWIKEMIKDGKLLKGDKGPQGIQGPEGKQGIQGPEGKQGIQGPEGKQGPQGPTDGYNVVGVPSTGDFSVKIAGKTGGVSKSNIYVADTGNIFFDTAPITDANKVDTPQLRSGGVGDSALKGKEPIWDNNIVWWELLKRKLLSKAEKDAVYTQSVIDTKLNLKANVGDSYTKKEHTDLFYTKIKTDFLLSKKATINDWWLYEWNFAWKALGLRSPDTKAFIRLDSDNSGDVVVSKLKQSTYIEPTSDRDYTPKKYVDDKIAASGRGSVGSYYTKEQTDTKIAKLEGSGIDLNKIIPLQKELEIITDIPVSIPHFTLPSATDGAANANYWINTFLKYGLVVGNYFKLTFPAGWKWLNASELAGKTFLLNVLWIYPKNTGNTNRYIYCHGYENGDTTKQAFEFRVGIYVVYVVDIDKFSYTTISTADWAPYGNVAAPNKYVKYLDYPEIDQKKDRLTQYRGEFTTHAALMSAQFGIRYRKTGTTKYMRSGAISHWFNDDVPAVWTENKLELKAFIGFDASAQLLGGESKLLPTNGDKLFYKEDILHYNFHIHANLTGKWMGLKFVFTDKNGVEFKTESVYFSNDYKAFNESYKQENLNTTTKAHLTANLFQSSYSQFNGTIKFEALKIHIMNHAIVNQKVDINKIGSFADIKYPTGFADDGIKLKEIQLFNVVKNTFEKIDDSVKFSNGTIIQLKEELTNKQLNFVKEKEFG